MSAGATESRARHLRKRSFSVAGHRTSVALEPEFWTVLETEARRMGRTLSGLVAQVDASRQTRPLASALRLAALAAASRAAG
jgi:predicted DNA-binding ribbon-helix-helix protein